METLNPKLRSRLVKLGCRMAVLKSFGEARAAKGTPQKYDLIQQNIGEPNFALNQGSANENLFL